MSFFQIGSEDLSPGEFEIGFMIPRREVDNGLEELGKEFAQIKQIIGPFSELSGENRPEVEIQSISSSEFQVFLVAAGPVAASFAYALDKLISSYERIVHIRLMNKELAEKDKVPDDILNPLSTYASQLVAADIEKIADEVIARSNLVDEGRLNEIRTDLKRQLRALAERIDHGYNVEVRVGELPEPDEEDVPRTRFRPDTQLDTEVSGVSNNGGPGVSEQWKRLGRPAHRARSRRQAGGALVVAPQGGAGVAPTPGRVA